MECVFYLTVKSIVVPQRLKGTLTYMRAPLPLAGATGAASAEASKEATSCEKLDFSLPVPCYSFLLAQQSCSPYATFLIQVNTRIDQNSKPSMLIKYRIYNKCPGEAGKEASV